MSTDINDPIRREQAYWYVDGLVELGTGILLILLGIVLTIEGIRPAASPQANTISFMRNLLMIAGTIVIGLAVKALKSRLTYPRTGYIAYPQPKGRELGKYLGLSVMLAFLFSLGLVLAMKYVPAVQTMIAYLPTWLMVWLGGIFGGVYLSWALRTGLQRFYSLAGMSLATGLVLAWQGRGLTLVTGNRYLLTNPGIFFIVMGIALCISGLVTLRNYLQKTHPQPGAMP